MINIYTVSDMSIEIITVIYGHALWVINSFHVFKQHDM